MKWFSHDTDMHRNRKIRKLIRTHGATGYAFWCVLLEKIYDLENGFQIEADELWFEDIAEDLKLGDYRTPIRILDTLAELGLISKQLWADHVIFVPSIASRGDAYMAKRTKEREKKRKQRAAKAQKRSEEGQFEEVSPGDKSGTKGQVREMSPAYSDPDPDPDLFKEKAPPQDETILPSIEAQDPQNDLPLPSPSSNSYSKHEDNSATDQFSAEPGTRKTHNATACFEDRFRASELPQPWLDVYTLRVDVGFVKYVQAQFSDMNTAMARGYILKAKKDRDSYVKVQGCWDDYQASLNPKSEPWPMPKADPRSPKECMEQSYANVWGVSIEEVRRRLAARQEAKAVWP